MKYIYIYTFLSSNTIQQMNSLITVFDQIYMYDSLSSFANHPISTESALFVILYLFKTNILYFSDESLCNKRLGDRSICQDMSILSHSFRVLPSSSYRKFSPTIRNAVYTTELGSCLLRFSEVFVLTRSGVIKLPFADFLFYLDITTCPRFAN